MFVNAMLEQDFNWTLGLEICSRSLEAEETLRDSKENVRVVEVGVVEW